MKIFRAKPIDPQHFSDEKIGLLDSFFFKRKRQNLGFNRRMFDEDFARLFSSMNRRNGKLFDIVSNDDELIQKLFGNIRTRYSRHSLDETIRDLVVEIALSLIWFGRAYYFLHQDADLEEVHIASFSSSGVVRLFGTHIQWVPKRSQKHWEQDDKELPREIRILDAAKVMRFDMPSSIKRILSAQNKTLAVLDKYQFEEATFLRAATYETPNPTSQFDFRVWRETQERALYRATRRTGWNGRKYDSLKRSGFFDCHRLIRFRRNQLLLRDEILKQISNELSRVGKSYNEKFSVEVLATDDLPTVRHLNELEVRLGREEVGFNEIIDYCYQR